MIDILTGKSLKSFVDRMVVNKLPRNAVDDIIEFIHGDDLRFIGLVTGLSMTGKTCMLCHAISRLTKDELEQTAFIILPHGCIWNDLEKQLNLLHNSGYRYIFIDEVTNTLSFIKNSQKLANFFSNAYGMRIVCSGSGSLALNFASKGPLATKSILFETTNISFSEWRMLINAVRPDADCTVIDYIRHGGILGTLGKMRLKRADYDNGAEDWKEGLQRTIGLNWLDDHKFYKQYLRSSIIDNIQNGLMSKRIADASVNNEVECENNIVDDVNLAREKYPLLYGLYKNNELTDVLQRLVGDTFHKIAVSMFNVRSNPEAIEQIVKNIGKKNLDQIEGVLSSKRFVDYLNQYLGFEFTHKQPYGKEIESEIFGYLRDIGVIREIESRTTIASSSNDKRIVFTLPGIKRQLCNGIVQFIRKIYAGAVDEFDIIPLEDRAVACDIVTRTFNGWMFEDTILLDCIRRAEKEEKEYQGIIINVYRFVNPKYLAAGETPFGKFDMVIQATIADEVQYALFEAKCTELSKRELEPFQCQHLDNEKLLHEVCKDGRIVFRAVLHNAGIKQYKGRLGGRLGPIHYMNATKFLDSVDHKGLLQFFDIDAFRQKMSDISMSMNEGTISDYAIENNQTSENNLDTMPDVFDRIEDDLHCNQENVCDEISSISITQRM